MLIAFGIGLGLSFADFRQLLVKPKAAVIGVMGQILLLPAVATTFAMLTDSPVLAVGLVLIGVCPGGSSSNYFSLLARGDVALSVTLTAVSGLLSVLTVPVVFNLAAPLVLDGGVEVALPLADTMKDLVLFLVAPVLTGMLIRHRQPGIAQRWSKPVSTLAFLVLVAITPILIWDFLGELYPVAAEAAALATGLICTMMLLGSALGKLTGCPAPQVRSLSIEIGVQNVALSIFLSVAYLKETRYLAVPIAYLIAMYAVLSVYIYFLRRSDAPTGADLRKPANL